MSYALTGGSAAREAELQKTLQSLLSRYNGALMPNSQIIPGAMNTGLFVIIFPYPFVIFSPKNSIQLNCPFLEHYYEESVSI